MQSYEKFVILFEQYLQTQKPLVESNQDLTKERKEDLLNRFTDLIGKGLNNCKVFEINEEIKKLLLLTKPPKLNEEVMLPFDFIFLDCPLFKKDFLNIDKPIKEDEVVGILVSKAQMQLSSSEKVVGTSLRLSICTLKNKIVDSKEGTLAFFETFNTDINIPEENKFDGLDITKPKYNSSEQKNLKTIVRNYVINFLNLVHSRNVNLIEMIRGEKNRARRIKQNKFPLPSSTRVVLTGDLLIYMNKLLSSGHINYSHKFWVRGHWRILRSEERYKDRAGTRVWIYPYIKGEGILVNKRYEVTKND